MHSLCTAVCPYAFYTVALDHMEAGKASILCSCEPVAAMVFGFFFFGAIPHNSKCRYGERGAADDIIEHFGNADAVPQPPERSLSRKAGIVWCCLREIPTVPSIAGLIIVLIALAMLVLSDKKQEVVEE